MRYDPNRPEWKGFAHQMRANPDCRDTRLVFADWLQEEYPGGRLHDFIRCQVQVDVRQEQGQGRRWTTSREILGRHMLPAFAASAPEVFWAQRGAFQATWASWRFADPSGHALREGKWCFRLGFPVALECT